MYYKENTIMKKILSVLIAGTLAAAVCVTMASCGGNSSSSSKTATTAPTKSTTAPATTTASNQQNSASGATGTQTSGNSGNNEFQSSLAQQGSEYFQPATNYQGDSIPDDKIYGGVWEQVAILNAVNATGDSGAMAIGDYKGTSPDGISCWVVTVKLSDGSTVVYYSGYQFCYPDSSSSSNSGNNDSNDNGNNNGGNNDSNNDGNDTGNDNGNNGYDNGNNGYDNGGSDNGGYQDDGEDNTVAIYPEY